MTRLQRVARLIPAVLALSAGLVVAGPHAVVAHAQVNCTDFAVLGVRGSGEDYKPDQIGMGVLPGAVGAGILHALPVSTTVLQVGLPYPAVPVSPKDWLSATPVGPSAVGELLGAGLVKPFSESIQAGASWLFKGPGSLTDILSRCPRTGIVLVGHSQGAAAIDYGLMLAAATGQADWVFRQIRAILLYGDPFHLPKLAYEVGSSTASGLLAWNNQITRDTPC